MRQPERAREIETRREIARRTAEMSIIAVGIAVAFVLLWYIGNAFLVVFAGVLVGSLLDAAVTGAGKLANVDRRVRFGVVLVVFAVLILGFLTTWGLLAAQQLGGMLSTLEQELDRWRSIIADSPLGGLLEGPDGNLMPLLPDPAGVVTRATAAITNIFGLIGSGILVLMLGIFFAYDPRGYREGVLRLFPPASRARLREVTDEAGSVLRWWMVGIGINMLVIALFTTAGLVLLGIPHAIILGMQAGVLAFVPNIGPVLAAAPILVVSLTQGYTMVFWALALYLAVQTLESNILTPLVQMEMVLLHPATILIVQLVMFALFGVIGLALATPLTAVVKVFVHRLYIEDWLGDRPA